MSTEDIGTGLIKSSRSNYGDLRDRYERYSAASQAGRYAAYVIPFSAVSLYPSWTVALATTVAVGKILKEPLTSLQYAFSYKAYNQDISVSERIAADVPETTSGKAKWLGKHMGFVAAWALAAGVTGSYFDSEARKNAELKIAAEKAETARINETRALPQLDMNAPAVITNRDYYCGKDKPKIDRVTIHGKAMGFNCGQ